MHAMLDHIALISASLEQGLAYCEQVLGIRPPKGGEHVRMGTHNHLLNLGDSVYLEIIAINPDAPPPDRARWFGMSDPVQQQRIKLQPCLATFVARTRDIAAAAAALPALGKISTMQRGALSWQMTIPDDGALLEDGMLPTLIEWPDGVDPTRAMPDLGCRLQRLEVRHPQPESLAAMWAKIGLRCDDKLVLMASETNRGASLTAYISTPRGVKKLSTV